MFDTLIIFLKEFFENVDFEKISRRQKSGKNFPGGKELKEINIVDVVLTGELLGKEPKTPGTEQPSVSFAEGTTFERDRTG